MASLVECGLSPLEALQSASTVNARLLLREAQIGHVAPGFDADLLDRSEPLEEIATLQRPLMVITNGRIALDRR